VRKTLSALLLLALPVSLVDAQLSQAEKKKLQAFLTSCPVTGHVTLSGPEGDAKKASNRLKNRATVASGFSVLPYPALEHFDQSEVDSFSDQQKADLKNGSAMAAVEVEGYVVDAAPGGCAKRPPPASSGESCNCNSTDALICDTHITLAPDKAAAADSTRHVIVEVTPRMRLKYAAQKRWTSDAIQQDFKGQTVVVKGWLFYDTDHECGAQATRKDVKPDCAGRDKTVWRATAWEVHPITSIEVKPTP
jgi:hypothetical protein